MVAQNNNSGARLSVLAFVAAFAVLCLHTRRYLPFIADDALISLRYAKRLIAGHGLTWNAGERVEGYSNLLWVLCSAVLGWAGLDLIDAVRVLGFAGFGATLAAVLYAHPPRTLRSWLPLFLVLLFLPLSGAMAAWAVGGMEQPMVAGLLAWAAVLCYPLLERRAATLRELLVPGLLFALLCWARLDGPVFVAAAAAAIFLLAGAHADALRKAAGLAALPVLFCLLQLGFRLAYYGEWIPNTALVKFTPSGQHALDGWGYLRAGAVALSPLFALAAASVALALPNNFMRARVSFLVALAGAWAAYVVVIGGDIFPAWRHFVPLLVLLALVAAVGAEWVGKRAGARLWAGANAAGVVLLCLFVLLQFRDEENFRAVSERWEWDGQVIGTLLKKAFYEEQPLVAVDPAGCLPYWSELPSLDMLGLNDYHLPRHPPPGFGSGPIGHELGDGKYVLDRQPDLVIFLLPTGSEHGYFLSGRQMQQDPRFFRDYTLVRFEGREPYTVRSLVWARKFSQRIGIRRTPERVAVPGFLLSDNPQSIARLGGDGRLIVPITRETAALIRGLELSPGRWRIEVEASRPSLKVKVNSSAEGKLLLDAPMPAEFDVHGAEGGFKVDVELSAASDDTAEVRNLTLTRLPQ